MKNLGLRTHVVVLYFIFFRFRHFEGQLGMVLTAYGHMSTLITSLFLFLSIIVISIIIIITL